MVTGVVGKSCSGKDSAVRYLVRNGFHEINVDHLGHEALEVKKEELRAAFGDGIFTDGHVNRKILGPIVFSDAERLETLNGITHPWMTEEVKRLIGEHENTCINAALLESMGLVPLLAMLPMAFSTMLARPPFLLPGVGLASRSTPPAAR